MGSGQAGVRYGDGRSLHRDGLRSCELRLKLGRPFDEPGLVGWVYRLLSNRSVLRNTEGSAAVLAKPHARLVAALAAPTGDWGASLDRRGDVHHRTRDDGPGVVQGRAAGQAKPVHFGVERPTARAAVSFAWRRLRGELKVRRGGARPNARRSRGFLRRCSSPGGGCAVCQRRLRQERGAPHALGGVQASRGRRLDHALGGLEAIAAVHAERHMVGVLPPTSITPHSRQEDNSRSCESRFCLGDWDETFTG